jgi:hypothetical protein
MARRPRVAARIERIAALAGNVSPRVGRRAGSGFAVVMALASCLLAALGTAVAVTDGDPDHPGPLRPAAEQAEGMTVADDGSVTFIQGHFEVSLRPMGAEELAREFPAAQEQGVLHDLTVFRLAAKNFEFPKVTFDRRGFSLRSADGREWPSRHATLNYSEPITVSSVMGDPSGLYSGQKASGHLMFEGLDADIRDIQVMVENVVLRFNHLGEPVQTMDLTYRFVR